MQKIEEKIEEILKNDVRYTEGLNACMSCGICTAICPAAEFFDYDPRNVITTVQSGDTKQIKELIESDTIWYCGQCMSCKTRCPRQNCPGLIINVLRRIAQETGAFTKSRMGRQQYLLRQGIGNNILKYGYSIHPSIVYPKEHPEQSPVWKWIFENRDDAYAVVGANLNGYGSGTLRKISDEALGELHEIFEETGGLDLFNKIDEYSQEKARELGIINPENEPDMDAYTTYLENEYQ